MGRSRTTRSRIRAAGLFRPAMQHDVFDELSMIAERRRSEQSMAGPLARSRLGPG